MLIEQDLTLRILFTNLQIMLKNKQSLYTNMHNMILLAISNDVQCTAPYQTVSL